MLKERLEMVNLSKVEKFYIEEHRKNTPESIAKQMRNAITQEVVLSYLNSLPSEEPDVFKTPDLMVVDNERGISIMTEAASERSDAVRDGQPSIDITERNATRIHRIK